MAALQDIKLQRLLINSQQQQQPARTARPLQLLQEATAPLALPPNTHIALRLLLLVVAQLLLRMAAQLALLQHLQPLATHSSRSSSHSRRRKATARQHSRATAAPHSSTAAPQLEQLLVQGSMGLLPQHSSSSMAAAELLQDSTDQLLLPGSMAAAPQVLGVRQQRRTRRRRIQTRTLGKQRAMEASGSLQHSQHSTMHLSMVVLMAAAARLMAAVQAATEPHMVRRQAHTDSRPLLQTMQLLAMAVQQQ